MQRDQKYDVLKGIAIIMMVAFHARLSRCLTHFGYLFHMPVFFILAGWFFNLEYAKSISSCIRFSKKKFIRLWWPMFVWGIVFVLLHNILLDWHLISTLGVNVPVLPTYTPQRWTRFDFIQNILEAPLLQADFSQLAGAFWFLQSLLFASVGYCVSSYILTAARINVFTIQTIIAATLIIAGRHFTIPLIGCIGGPHTLSAYALIHLGVLLRHFDLRIAKMRTAHIVITTALCFVTLLGLAKIGSIELSINRFNSCGYLLMCSVAGWYFLLGLASLITGKAAVVLAYIGANTLPIVIFHFLAFKPVSALGVSLTGLPPCRLADFPVTFSSFGWSIAYTISGIGMPLLLNHVYQKAKSYFYGRPTICK